MKRSRADRDAPSRLPQNKAPHKQSESATTAPALTPQPDMRVDIWLWRTRFFKSRSLAAQAIAAGKLRITRADVTRRVDKAGSFLHVGDRLNLIIGSHVWRIDVIALPARRGPASEAQRHYRSIMNSAIDSA